MKKIELEIKALSPLAVGRQKPGGSVSEADDYIPGTVIRGAIASEILKRSGHQFSNLSENGGHFQALFLDDEPAIFTNAYPAALIIKGKIISQDRIERIKFLPATALSSKTKSGFKTGKPLNNGVFDSLIDRFCGEFYDYEYDPNCPEDGKRVEPYSSFYTKFKNKYYSLSVTKRLLTRVGINRKRATSEEDILYSIEVLNESESTGKNPKPVIYKSAIIIRDDLADFLWEFIDNPRSNFRLGGSSSRGLGKVKIEAQKPIEFKPTVENKIEKFNTKLKERWANWNIFGNPIKELPNNRTYFSLDLQSDAMLTEKWRRTTVISEEMLKLFTGVEDSSLKLEATYSSYDYRSGWNSAWGLMKDVELVTNKGAVYLFSTTHLESWYEKLAKLELDGVGERTCEGFGQVEICDDFHLILREDRV
ncbi:Csx10 family CRISPR-associated RAMP protein [Calothrix parasitica NIES-267]|uniref:Csx10 family CRISPR-associated RAMP protein n=1 Tax=Calothrix parasitica NIES-267 TaxID=1973488 RepID=A0A1Z4LPA5_9CYAN|nr:Csx10 family CRISPR-associated RAMP protein [Calothrix parasitica NIES-267]